MTAIEEATADYLLSFERLHQFGDYFVLNVSSPNTPGLRSLQDREALTSWWRRSSGAIPRGSRCS